jgi:hypothetical protein
VVRVLDALTGLFAAGMLVLGVGLLLAQLLAPALLSAAGRGVATGPGWIRVLVHLLVGGFGEAVYRTRHRRTGPGDGGRRVRRCRGARHCLGLVALTDDGPARPGTSGATAHSTGIRPNAVSPARRPGRRGFR